LHVSRKVDLQTAHGPRHAHEIKACIGKRVKNGFGQLAIGIDLGGVFANQRREPASGLEHGSRCHRGCRRSDDWGIG
jgi:hypothetical protein